MILARSHTEMEISKNKYLYVSSEKPLSYLGALSIIRQRLRWHENILSLKIQAELKIENKWKESGCLFPSSFFFGRKLWKVEAQRASKNRNVFGDKAKPEEKKKHN